MKLWYLTAVLAFIGAAGAITTVVRGSDQPIGPEVGGGIVAFVVMAVLTVLLYRVDALNSRLDRNGLAVPAEDPAVPPGTRWTLDQIASVLALWVEPFNGVVFADERTGTIRVMIDPPTAITEVADDRRVGDDRSSSGPSIMGRWTRIRMRPGRLPQLKLRKSNVNARLNHLGRMVPVWGTPALGSGAGGRQTRNVVRAGQGPPISFRYDSRELWQAVDAIAVRAGWASAAAVASRPVDPKADHVVRTVERTTSTATTSTSSTSTSTATSSTSTGSEVAPPVTPDAVHAMIEKARRDGAKDDAKISMIMTVIGGGILAGCLIGTILGLIFGMPWWASFIIIGSGLLFCLLFVLPVWIAFGRPGRARQT